MKDRGGSGGCACSADGKWTDQILRKRDISHEHWAIVRRGPAEGVAGNYVYKELDCTLSFNFVPDSLVLNQDGSCGMGLNVSAAGTYKRVSSAPPKFDE